MGGYQHEAKDWIAIPKKQSNNDDCAIDLPDKTLLVRRPAGVLKTSKYRDTINKDVNKNKSSKMNQDLDINHAPRKAVRINGGKPTDQLQECVVSLPKNKACIRLQLEANEGLSPRGAWNGTHGARSGDSARCCGATLQWGPLARQLWLAVT